MGADRMTAVTAAEFIVLFDAVAGPLARVDERVRAILEGLANAPEAGWSTPPPRTRASVAHVIDHTILRPDATATEVRTVCAEARQFGCAGVCVNPVRVPLVARELAYSGVLTCAVVGFPLGASRTETKCREVDLAISDGARELDMVIDVGALKETDYVRVYRDIAAVAQICHAGNAALKTIIEACLLTDAEKFAACVLAKAARADFVKTSTGFSKSGATAADVALMRRVVGNSCGVKAAGGIRTLADLQAMVAAGASRIGASATAQMVEAAQS
jgi:deoxyribose-phosphate aldolase